MAKKTGLGPTATPGRRRTFVAKTEAAALVTPAIRTVIIAVESRSRVIASESRTATIAASTRTVII